MTWLVMWFAAVGCGRIAFDPLGGGKTDAAPGTGDAGSSCSELATMCGPAKASPCCGSLPIPGGTFYRGYDVGTDNSFLDMTNPATVSDFRLDVYEVTVGRFRQFVNAGMGTQQNPPLARAGARALNGITDQGGWDATWNAQLAGDPAALMASVKCTEQRDAWTDLPGTNENLPMNCITWYEAMAFCLWDGGFLPTEAEWNYAAVGGSEQRAYPWSNPPSSVEVDCSYAHFGNGMCTPPVEEPVGSESPKGDGRWGHADLGSNVDEWTLDWFGPFPNPCIDCADLTTSARRGHRGGNFILDALSMRGASRDDAPPDSRDIEVGVRCAR